MYKEEEERRKKRKRKTLENGRIRGIMEKEDRSTARSVGSGKKSESEGGN